MHGAIPAGYWADLGRIEGPYRLRPRAGSSRATAYSQSVEVSDLQRLTPVDERTAALATDAVRVFSDALNSRTIASVAETLGRFEQAAKLVDMPAMRETAKVFESMRPIVAPRIAPQIAESLKAISARTASLSETFKRIDPPPFRFAKTLDDLNAAMIQPRVAESLAETLRTLAVPNIFNTGIADMLRDLPRVAPADLAPRVEEAAEEVVALAEIDDVAEIADESVGRLEQIPPARRRMLAIDVAVLIAALLALAAHLSASGDVRDPKGVGLTLACVAALVRVYWRLAGKLD
jgi:hypothetical protein